MTRQEQIDAIIRLQQQVEQIIEELAVANDALHALLTTPLPKKVRKK